jgi:hypothetical protein
MHGGEQAQLVEHRRMHLLRLVDQHHRSQKGRLQMGQLLSLGLFHRHFPEFFSGRKGDDFPD